MAQKSGQAPGIQLCRSRNNPFPSSSHQLGLKSWGLFGVDPILRDTPKRTNGWNLKITHLEKEKHLNQTFIVVFSMLLFRGVVFHSWLPWYLPEPKSEIHRNTAPPRCNNEDSLVSESVDHAGHFVRSKKRWSPKKEVMWLINFHCSFLLGDPKRSKISWHVTWMKGGFPPNIGATINGSLWSLHWKV